VRKIILKKNIEDIEPLLNLLEQIKQTDTKVNVSGLVGASRSYLVSLLFTRLEQTLLVVCPEEKEAAAMARDLILFLGEENVICYPPLDFRTVDMFALQRQEELIRLEVQAKPQINSRTVVVTSVLQAIRWSERFSVRACFRAVTKESAWWKRQGNSVSAVILSMFFHRRKETRCASKWQVTKLNLFEHLMAPLSVL